jgi:FkbM family methyltransferase
MQCSTFLRRSSDLVSTSSVSGREALSLHGVITMSNSSQRGRVQLDQVREHASLIAQCVLNYKGRRRSLIRRYAFDLMGYFSPVVVVEGEEGMRFCVSTSDKLVGRFTFMNGDYELHLMRRAIELISADRGVPSILRGKTFMDVGANIGTALVPALRLFGADSGIAFEPEPANYRLLQINLVANGLDQQVQLFPMALSDHAGTSVLELSATNWGDHRVRMPGASVGDDGEAERSTITVPVRRFDDLVANGEVDLGRLGIAWMDVQGHEGHVLAGATTLLESSTPVVVEFWPYGLRRSGGLNLLLSLVRDHYKRIIDLRNIELGSPPDIIPTSRVDELTSRYSGQDYTDLVLLK